MKSEEMVLSCRTREEMANGTLGVPYKIKSHHDNWRFGADAVRYDAADVPDVFRPWA